MSDLSVMPTALKHLVRVAAERQAVKRNYARAMDLRYASQFSIFELIDTSELGLSKMIAWLLDPNESHGQQNAFLREFLNLIYGQGDGKFLPTPHVVLEYATSDRRDRADIIVHLHGQKIVIENKPYATEGTDQIGRYFDTYKPDRLLFLTENGREPETAGRFVDRVVSWSYVQEFTLWLERCLSACQSARVETFIRAFREFCQKRFGGMTGIADDVETAAWVATLVSANDIRAAFSLGRSFEDSQKQMLRRLESQIKENAHDADLMPFCKKLKHDDALTIDFYGYQLLPDNIAAGFFLQNDWPRFGLSWIDQQRDRDVGRKWGQALDSRFDDSKSVVHTPSWLEADKYLDFRLPANWKMDDRLWQSIADGTLSKEIFRFAKNIVEMRREQNL